MPKRTFLAVVQRDDDPANDDTHIVHLTFTDAGLPVIELTDGTRITAVEELVVFTGAERAAA